jgi:hypothetical protein
MPADAPCAAACDKGAGSVKKSAPTTEPLAAIAEIVRFMMFAPRAGARLRKISKTECMPL